VGYTEDLEDIYEVRWYIKCKIGWWL